MKVKTEKHTIPLLYTVENYDDELEPEFEGCGVLFSHGSELYIFSVAHVFERATNKYSKEELYIPKSNEMINFSYKLLVDDNFDIAIAKIDSEDKDKFSDFEPITKENISYYLPKGTNEVYLSGFPSQGVEFNPELSTLGHTYYYGNLGLHEENISKNYKKIHSTIYIKYPSDWDKKGLYNPKGMSGSGVWIENKNGDPELFGINQFFDGTDCISAHRIHLYMEIMRKYYDDSIQTQSITKVSLS